MAPISAPLEVAVLQGKWPLRRRGRWLWVRRWARLPFFLETRKSTATTGDGLRPPVGDGADLGSKNAPMAPWRSPSKSMFAGQQWTRLPSGAPQLHQHYNRERAPPLALLAPDPANTPGPPAFGRIRTRLTRWTRSRVLPSRSPDRGLQPLCADDVFTQRPACRPETLVQDCRE